MLHARHSRSAPIYCPMQRCACVCSALLTPSLVPGLWWSIEQPGSSIMHLHPKLQARKAILQFHRVALWMKSYGSSSPKGTSLYGNAPYLDMMASSIPRHEQRADPSKRVSVHTTSSDGTHRVTGGPDLKPTQAYPPQYGL
eukprot:10986721-Alexandrium_andersonii.AAC.2